jgi:hypothetical protein
VRIRFGALARPYEEYRTWRSERHKVRPSPDIFSDIFCLPLCALRSNLISGHPKPRPRKRCQRAGKPPQHSRLGDVGCPSCFHRLGASPAGPARIRLRTLTCIRIHPNVAVTPQRHKDTIGTAGFSYDPEWPALRWGGTELSQDRSSNTLSCEAPLCLGAFVVKGSVSTERTNRGCQWWGFGVPCRDPSPCRQDGGTGHLASRPPDGSEACLLLTWRII